MTLREKLIQLRDKAGVSQLTLANELGVTRQTVSRWESGRTVPSDKTLQALAEYYQVSAAWLSGECEEPTKQLTMECIEEKKEVPQNRQSRKAVLTVIGALILVVLCCVCFYFRKPEKQDATELEDMKQDYFELSDENSFEFEWGNEDDGG